ncbi:MAG: tetratricopeptide repeat protein [Promicromonosporaceae bacterium]|nr:tetratricopeptide repeat protein [Promicromonosporaceae bacterium]
MSAIDPGFSVRGAVDLSALNAPQVPPPGTEGGAPAAGGHVVDVTMDTFQQVIESSQQYPVVMLLWIPTDPGSAQLAGTLGALVEEQAGRLLLARVDVQAHPQIAQAFGVQGVPTAVAVLAGQPLPLFGGPADEAQVREVLTQVLQAAEANGITGRVPAAGEAPEAAEPEEAPLPPLHQEAFDAIERGDFPAAVVAYEAALKQDPKDTDALAGLAQSRLFVRLADIEREEGYAAALGDPTSVPKALVAADLEVIDGGISAAFDRLLALLPSASGEDKETIRVRLLEYFEIVGPTHPAVGLARRKLSLYLY